MRILISNDDGIQAKGIQYLCEAVAKDAEVVVVAPNRERSASSHGITLFQTLEVTEAQVPGAAQAFMTSGTPVDCVKWALSVLHPETPFDFMLSGINAGVNLGSDVLYSGTVAAAGEAALMGVSSIAFSMMGPPFPFGEVADAAYKIFQQLRELTLPADTFLSVNFPEHTEASKTRWTTLGVRKYNDQFKTELDERGVQVYRYGGEIVDERGDGQTDVDAIREGYISITPLRYRFTNEEYYAQQKS